jgi:glycosyltransferase involved in cell wall biosynthesis
LKVALVLKYFLPEHIAGTEVYVAALCNGLLKLGIEVFVIKPGYNLKSKQQYFYKGIRVIEYPESSAVDKKLITSKTKTKGLSEFKSVLKSEAPTIVHFHEISGSNGITINHVRIANDLNIKIFTTLHLPGYVCKTGTFRFKNKFNCSGVIDSYKCSVCMLHSRGAKYGAGEALSFIGKWILDKGINLDTFENKSAAILSYPTYINNHLLVLKELFSKSEKVFVLSNWFKSILLLNKLPESKIVLLPKAIPFNFFDEKEYSKEISGHIRFVYVGRITEIKGLHIALEALLKIDSNKWTLDIYGPINEDIYYKKCKAISNKINAGRVNWNGIIAPTEVVNILKRYDALIFPTISEEMVGLVVQEAFAAKITVIGSNIRGIAEQVEDGLNALLFEPGNIIALENLIRMILKDKSKLKFLTNNIPSVISFDETALKILRIYEINNQN